MSKIKLERPTSNQIAEFVVGISATVSVIIVVTAVAIFILGKLGLL